LQIFIPHEVSEINVKSKVSCFVAKWTQVVMVSSHRVQVVLGPGGVE